ncbi:MAG: rhomboid family intramembrane serine protease [Ignavibacteria bacterium]|jgi:membrane associated rhomboid family serine protease
MSAHFGQGRMGAFPPVIKFLLACNVIVFIIYSLFLQGMTFGGIPVDQVVMENFALWPAGSGSFFPWQLLSYQFMHGGISHLLFNMLALWMFGVELEYIWGSRKFATYYILSGVAAGVVHLVVTPLLGGGLAPTIGASGSIMGVLLAFGMTFPDRPIMMFPLFFPIPARIFVMIYAGFDLISGLFNAGDGVAHFAHLGGALGGFLLIKFGEPLFRKIEGSQYSGSQTRRPNIIDADFRDVPQTPRYDYQAPTQPQRETQPQTPTKFVVDGQPISQEQIDQILDKISKGGYHGLSEREKNILFEVSRQL